MSSTLVTPEVLAAMRPPAVAGDSDKSDRGTVLTVAGGGAVPGAARLTGLAAMRVGAGRLRLAAPAHAAVALGVAILEAMVVTVPGSPAGGIAARAARTLAPLVESSQAVVVGPGMMNEKPAQRLARDLLKANPQTTFVIDAAAMPDKADAEVFAALANGRVVLTPHAGEMADLAGWEKDAIEADPEGAARLAAERFQSVIVLKGPHTFIVSPDGKAWRHEHDVPGLATSGSGDVLAGAIAGLLARGSPPLAAAVWGVHLHAGAGADLAKTMPLGFLAGELLAVLPKVLAAS